jgi:hypothetical protein
MSSFIPELQAKINLLEEQLKYLIREQNSLISFIVEEKKGKKPRKKLTPEELADKKEKERRAKLRKQLGVGINRKREIKNAIKKARQIATRKTPNFDAGNYVRNAVQDAVLAMTPGEAARIRTGQGVRPGEDPTVSALMRGQRTKKGTLAYRDPRVEKRVPGFSSGQNFDAFAQITPEQAAIVGTILDPKDGSVEKYFGPDLKDNPEFGERYRQVRKEKDAELADEEASLAAAREAAEGSRRLRGMQELIRAIGGTSVVYEPTEDYDPETGETSETETETPRGKKGKGKGKEPKRKKQRMTPETREAKRVEREIAFGKRVFAQGVAAHSAKSPGKFAETSMELAVPPTGFTPESAVTSIGYTTPRRTPSQTEISAVQRIIPGEIRNVRRLRQAGGGEIPVLRAAEQVLKSVDPNDPSASGVVVDALGTGLSQEGMIRKGRRNPSNPRLPRSVGPLGREDKLISKAMEKVGVTSGDVPARSPVPRGEEPAPGRGSDLQFAVTALRAQKAGRTKASKTPVVGDPSAVRKPKPPVEDKGGSGPEIGLAAGDFPAGTVLIAPPPAWATSARRRKRMGLQQEAFVPRRGEEVNEVAKTYMKMISENYNRWY